MKLALSVALIATGIVVVIEKPVTRSGTVRPALLLSREPELRASRGARRAPLSRRVNTSQDIQVKAHPRGDLRGGQWKHDWTAVAQCESSGNWHDNTGNSYYGGLQENEAFWRNYGGLAYAARPDLATEAEQIVVAERGLAVQGRGAWPYCGRFL